MKEYVGIFLFSLTYIAIASQAVAVFMTWDEDILSYILLHKLYFSVIATLAVISHVRASFTNPGRISHDNNQSVLEFYLVTHKDYINKAEDLNIQYRQYFQMVKKTMPPEEDDEHSDIESGDEDVEYSQETDISDAQIEMINSDHKMKFERCKRCFVVRVPNTHHCSNASIVL